MENILVTRSSIPELSEYIEEIRDIFASHWLTNMGPKHEEFREALRKYLGIENIELFTNGHMALELTLQAMDFPEGSEVITTPFTFASTTHVIVRNKLTPVFCDIRKDNYTIDPAKIEALITEKTVAILPVHVYGNICDTDGIDLIAKKHSLKVIYDAAHTFGEKHRGESTARFGDASCFSFHATKAFNSIEGGAACFSDNSLNQKLYHLKNFGIDGPESVGEVGANAKLNEFCAAMGICNLRHLENEIEKRRKVFETYIDALSDISGIKLPSIPADVSSNYAYFPVLFDKDIFGAGRDEVYNALVEENIYPRKYFYPLTSNYSCYKGAFENTYTPVAESVSNQVLTLPLYADLSLDIIEKICGIIAACRHS